MTATERDIAVGVLVFFLLAFFFWLFRNAGKPQTSVSMTVIKPPQIMQDCVADDGTHFQWPVSSGACPRVTTAF